MLAHFASAVRIVVECSEKLLRFHSSHLCDFDVAVEVAAAEVEPVEEPEDRRLKNGGCGENTMHEFPSRLSKQLVAIADQDSAV